MTAQNYQSKKEVARQESVLPTEFLQRIGLSDSELPEVYELASTLDAENGISITDFGKVAAEATIDYADRMLEMVNTNDLDQTGRTLNEILTKAKQINTSGLAVGRSKIPFFGSFVDKVRVHYSSTMAQFASAREAIDTASKEIKQTKSSLEQRIIDLDHAFTQVQAEYHALGKYIAAGKLVGAKMVDDIAERSMGDQTPMSVQKISDLRAFHDKVEKRVADLMVLQQNALNTLPAIRLVQSNNAILIDKYNTISTLTIPVWKRQIMLGLSLSEQEESVELAEKIDDFTNSLLKKQADLLKKNTLATARANQRLVIDVDTINHVQKTLISTVAEVTAIQQKASTDRQIASNKIMDLRQKMQNQLTAPLELEPTPSKSGSDSVH